MPSLYYDQAMYEIDCRVECIHQILSDNNLSHMVTRCMLYEMADDSEIMKIFTKCVECKQIQFTNGEAKCDRCDTVKKLAQIDTLAEKLWLCDTELGCRDQIAKSQDKKTALYKYCVKLNGIIDKIYMDIKFLTAAHSTPPEQQKGAIILRVFDRLDTNDRKKRKRDDDPEVNPAKCQRRSE